MRLASILFLLGAFTVVLWFGGALSFPAPTSRSEATEDTAGSEADAARAEWSQRVTAICEWERQRYRDTIRRLHGPLHTKQQVESVLQSLVQLDTDTFGIFKRLEPPPGYGHEVRIVRGLLARQHRAALEMLQAVHAERRHDFMRALRKVQALSERASAKLSELGVRGCDPKAQEIPQDSGRLLA